MVPFLTGQFTAISNVVELFQLPERPSFGLVAVGHLCFDGVAIFVGCNIIEAYLPLKIAKNTLFVSPCTLGRSGCWPAFLQRRGSDRPPVNRARRHTLGVYLEKGEKNMYGLAMESQSADRPSTASHAGRYASSDAHSNI